VAVISVGAVNGYGHPHRDVKERLWGKLGTDKVYFTSESGNITFTTDGTKLWVETER
jgi:beta-lactamase superfamily II metal-dependent hydrolase